MRKLVLILTLTACCLIAQAQKKAIDSLNRLIVKATSDTERLNLKLAQFKLLSNGNLDTAIAYGRNLVTQAQKNALPKAEAQTRIILAGDYSFTGNYAAAQHNLDSAQTILLRIKDTLSLGKMYDHYGTMNAMQNKFGIAHSFYNKAINMLNTRKEAREALSTIYQNNAISYQQESDFRNALNNYQQALKLTEQIKDDEGMAFINLNIGITYNSLGENKRAEQSFLKAITLAKKLELKNVLAYAYANLASVYADLGESARQYDFAMKAAALGEAIGDKGIEASSLSRAATALAAEKKFDDALKLSSRSIGVAAASNQPYNLYQAYTGRGFILKSQNNYRQAIPYFEKGFKSLSQSDIYSREVGLSYGDLSECYEKTGNFSSALAAYKIAARITDSVRGKENIKNATELRMNYEFDKKQQLIKNEQVKKDADNKRIKNQQYFLISVLGLIVLAVLTIAFIQFKNNRQKQRAYNLLQRQKKETDGQRVKTEQALSELQLTQSQLIQSAKMASLGELTAGIAHEIQNPLNFVNNFSEVSAELIAELDEELIKGDITEARTIAGDVRQNLEKIHHHGKRADSIVKSMLEHSRTSAGEKQPANINKLADEYLRLAYHGLRAKDKSFNARLVTDFNQDLPPVNVLQQDIGRVFINLFSNAFYAVNEKAKTAGKEYEPEVEVRTARQNGAVLIKIKDNGTGIPANIREKIMQPFFTTKPTGESTGLGLSLSYDIVVKGHGGDIDVQSIEGAGSEFTVSLPFI